MRNTLNCCCLVKSCPTLSDPIDCIACQVPLSFTISEFAQIRIHWVGDAIWPPNVKSCLTGKHSDAGTDWRQKEKGTTEDEVAR